MLYRVIVNNYKSFAEEQQFDMFPNPKRVNFPCHVLKSKQNIPVLKECAIYGANGSGKSNFIKLLQFLKDFVTEDMFSLQKLNNWYHINRFKLPIAKNNTPIEILIEFGINEIVYIYSLSIDDKGVKEEKLYLSGKGYNEEVLVFSRNYSDIEFTITHISPEIENIFKRQLSSNPAASVCCDSCDCDCVYTGIVQNPSKRIKHGRVALQHVRFFISGVLFPGSS